MATVIAPDDLPRLSALHPIVKFAVAPLLGEPSAGSLVQRLLAILEWSPAQQLTATVITPEPPPPRLPGF